MKSKYVISSVFSFFQFLAILLISSFSYAIVKTEIPIQVIAVEEGINVSTHYIPAPKENETPMQIFYLGYSENAASFEWKLTGSCVTIDKTFEPNPEGGDSRLTITPVSAGIAQLSLVISYKPDSNGNTPSPKTFGPETIYVYKVEIKKEDGTNLEDQIFIGKDQERKFKAKIIPTEMETAVRGKLKWDWTEKNGTTLNIFTPLVNPVTAKGKSESPKINGTELNCTLIVNDTFQPAYNTSCKLTVVVPKIEADITDLPPLGLTYTSGVNSKSIELVINGKKILTPLTTTPITDGIHILYEAIYSDIKIPGTNKIELNVRDNANAGIEDGQDINKGGNETDPNPFTWEFTIP